MSSAQLWELERRRELKNLILKVKAETGRYLPPGELASLILTKYVDEISDDQWSILHSKVADFDMAGEYWDDDVVAHEALTNLIEELEAEQRLH
jgi:hypothetical protein